MPDRSVLTRVGGSTQSADRPSVVVFGQVARDLVLLIEELPAPGGSVSVQQRREILGGKGANQAVGLVQLGTAVALVGVVGDDRAGEEVLAQARRDGIDVSCVVTRQAAATSLLVDVVDRNGQRRLLEDTPSEVLLTAEDVARAAELVTTADTVVVQSQQPGEAVLAALRLGREHNCRTVVDGAPDMRVVAEALALTDVLRADEEETRLLIGPGTADPLAAARKLLTAGPSMVLLAAGGAGNLVAWHGGHRLVPLSQARVVDRTGAGDVAVAVLVVALQDGRSPAEAAELAAAAQADTVQRLGGRPDLDRRSRDPGTNGSG